MFGTVRVFHARFEPYRVLVSSSVGTAFLGSIPSRPMPVRNCTVDALSDHTLDACVYDREFYDPSREMYRKRRRGKCYAPETSSIKISVGFLKVDIKTYPSAHTVNIMYKIMFLKNVTIHLISISLHTKCHVSTYTHTLKIILLVIIRSASYYSRSQTTCIILYKKKKKHVTLVIVAI